MDQDALQYHEAGRPGKLAIRPTKPLDNQRDLALAYSPGVAEASSAIAERPEDAARYTARANLVAVVTNGSAVLGLGNIGALAAKPVMEGKAVLFKRFARHRTLFDTRCQKITSDRPAARTPPSRDQPGGHQGPDGFRGREPLKSRDEPRFHDDQEPPDRGRRQRVVNRHASRGQDLGSGQLVSTGGGADRHRVPECLWTGAKARECLAGRYPAAPT